MFSMQAMLRDRAARLVVASVLRTYAQPRLLSNTPCAHARDGMFAWVGGGMHQCMKGPTRSQLRSRVDLNQFGSDGGEVPRLYDAINYIRRRQTELDLSALRGLSPVLRVAAMRLKFHDDRYPLVAAANALAELDDTITVVISEIEKVHPLELKIAGFQRDQEVIRQTLDALKPYAPAEICSAVSCCCWYANRRLQKED
jgi:hypothetical protein